MRVNAVAPGFVETPILDTVPHKVLQDMKDSGAAQAPRPPEEIANVYAFLASDEASYVNDVSDVNGGAVLEVSGGMTV